MNVPDGDLQPKVLQMLTLFLDGVLKKQTEHA